MLFQLAFQAPDHYGNTNPRKHSQICVPTECGVWVGKLKPDLENFLGRASLFSSYLHRGEDWRQKTKRKKKEALPQADSMPGVYYGSSEKSQHDGPCFVTLNPAWTFCPERPDCWKKYWIPLGVYLSGNTIYFGLCPVSTHVPSLIALIT